MVEGGARPSVTQPLRDHHHVDTGIDKLGGMGMSQGVECDVRHADRLGKHKPLTRELLGRGQAAVDIRE